MTLDVVVGGLYGSEAKGHVTQRLVERRLAETGSVLNIRVGGPNAGHTGYDDALGKAWPLRQVPVGVVNKGRIKLLIAAGSEIDLPVLLDEIDQLTDDGLLGGDYGHALYVSSEATLITDEHKQQEAELVGRIGSTGKGIGAARAARLLRTAKRVMDDERTCRELEARGVPIIDWTPVAKSTIVEGVQGYALGLHAGFYPQCTTSDCRAIDFLSMAGISPWDVRYGELKVWVVGRIYPIRVAGNSGPMRNEVSWDRLGLNPEFTTVTKKMRRVGLPDWDLMREAIDANGGTAGGVVRVALSMVDQAHGEVTGIPWSADDPQWHAASKTLEAIERELGVPIELVMSGPKTAAFREVE